MSASPALALAADASPDEIAAMRARLAHLATLAEVPRPEAGPFLLVTPLGLGRREALEQALAAAGIEISTRTPVAFPSAATAIYVQRADDEALHRAAAFERLWEARGGGAAERWALTSMEAFSRLLRAKRALRAAVPSWPARVSTPRRAWVARLHAFHAPDPERLDVEARLLAVIVAETDAIR